MTQAKHTPGPWEIVVKDDKYGQETLIVGGAAGDEYRPVVCGCIMKPDEDGHLIAAAPELLETLDDMVFKLGRLVGSEHHKDYHDCLAKARAAIAKAKGENA